MIGKILKYYAIARAPKTTLTVLYPKKAARLVKTRWDLKHAWAPRITAVLATAAALPLGIALGRITKRRPRSDKPS